MPPRCDPLERLLSRVEVSGDCWLWPGAQVHGYGYIGSGVGKQCVYTHRLAYDRMVGPIPDGLEIDHTCNNRACVNPDHLEPVTHQVNMARGVARRGA